MESLGTLLLGFDRVLYRFGRRLYQTSFIFFFHEKRVDCTPIMGLETTHVLSDERHHGPFVCTICTNLCGLDALVTTTCSHVFCKLCLKTWLSSSSSSSGNNHRRCPTCNQSVVFDGTHNELPTMMIGNHSVHAMELQKCQPVAHRVLKRIRVKCPLRSKHRCPWTGDYGDLQDHLLSTTAHSATKMGVVETVRCDDNGDPNEDNHVSDDEMMEVDETDSRMLAGSFKEEANSMFASANFEQARDLYAKGISMLQEVPHKTTDDGRLLATLHTNRAAALLKLKAWQDCAADCSAAIKIDPTYVKAYIRRTKALVELGRFEEACTELETACAKNPKSNLLAKELVSALSIRDRANQGQENLQRQKFVEAKSVFGNLLLTTSAERVVVGAAKADLGLGLTDSALRLSLQILRKNPQAVEGYRIRGQSMTLAGEFDKAIAVVREALRLDPDNQESKTALKQCKRIKEALQEARQAFFYRRFEESATAYTNAINGFTTDLPAKAPLYSILYAERGETWLRLKDYAAALRDSARAIYARDDSEKAWLTKVKAYHGLERHAEAREELEDLLRRWGSNSPAIRKAYETADFLVRKQERPDFYELLELSSLASLMEIKKQYKVKAMQYHPDRYSSNKFNEEQRAQAEEKFKLLGEALEILSDDFKRQLYDEGYDLAAIRERVEAAQRAAHRPHRY